MKELFKLPANVVITKIKNGEFTAEEYISVIIERINKTDIKINSFITKNFENALEKSKKIDQKIQKGEKTGNLAGIPIGIKDNINVKGLKNTCASKMLSDYVSPFNATVVERIEKQDGIIIGKLNMDEFGMGSTSEFSAYGPVRNPWNIDYVAGGSSGGSAAAVSSLQIPISLGSDTGGSIRCPSSFCSVVGLKPTYGSISRNGLVSYSNSLEQIGPIARTIFDIVPILNTISGEDINDNTTSDLRNDCIIKSDEQLQISRLKVGILSDLIQSSDSQIVSGIQQKIDLLEKHHCYLENIKISMIDFAVASYYIIATAEASSNLSRFDNIRYGYTLNPEGYEWTTYFSKARSLFGDEVKRRILLGSYVLSAGYFGKYYAKAQLVRSLIRNEFENLFKKFDVILLPTMPVLPFKLGEKISNPVDIYNLDLFTIIANLTGLPAISIPAGFSKEGFPFGVQLITNAFDEQKLVDFAVLFERTSNYGECDPGL
ncbi:Asp-tRNA(Asn)/Glu-tRNA(Gln) amidotransferase subunit GatA [Candidatus Nitrosocosmicus hydrocola]|uniref:Asp-tRNA(Asn)/Glu-tRNA(Gln) amidotransferase subunit GatA n=1 Tax=Candidatus Nitrosocosmicus hydrocola TaxID=1826872 RepID=UPI000A58CD94|nr:Asp-tRNA(Asn)/Glu-tRNA(Gln) amidotransferase subunit GatA [Candidatus Nitrosocosmicus hydrocola]